MSDTEVERYEEGDEVEETDGPRQQIRRMPDDEIEKSLGDGVGPFFPSGMSAPEAALAGATADMSEDEVARLRGERDDELADEDETV